MDMHVCIYMLYILNKALASKLPGKDIDGEGY